MKSRAAGTPVIARNEGCPTETVANGRTGVLVDDFGAASAAVSAIEHVPPQACRTQAMRCDTSQFRRSLCELLSDFLTDQVAPAGHQQVTV